MNKPFYILFFVLIFSVFQFKSSIAQTNLIYNGDFELYDSCPTSTSSPGDDQMARCSGWYNPTYATSDYYNSCASSPVGTPNNGFGYQIPYSGNAYCGILLQYYSQPPITINTGWWIEYIQGNLVSPLKSGYEYEFSCHIVFSDLGWDYAFWKFGAYFSQTAVSKLDAKPFSGILPQVMNNPNNFITDTVNWIEIKGKFFAQGGEEYITVGLYMDTLAPDTLRQFTGFAFDPTNTGGYYFIDACGVSETGNFYEYPNVFSPNGDGINDEWNPFLAEEESIEIFNRWGIKIYEILKQNQTWDGKTIAGLDCVDGVYYFIINKKNEKINTIKKGFIQLVR